MEKSYDFYCYQCQLPYCSQCLLDNHSSAEMQKHIVVAVEKAYSIAKSEAKGTDPQLDKKNKIIKERVIQIMEKMK